MTNNKQKPPQFNRTFPVPIQDVILDYLNGDLAESKPNLYNASHVCTLFEGGTKKKPYDKLALIALLNHVVKGEQEQAEAIIRTNPALLFISGNVKDLAGNTFIHYSPCQLACYARDVDMLKMMKLYLDDSQKIQFNNILREADEASKKQEPYDFSFLVAAIMDDDYPEGKASALAAFKKEFGPREIKNEKSFNIKTLIQAYELHIHNYYPWGSAEKCALFWCEVVGYLQRIMPTVYVQAFCQGLVNAFVNAEAGIALERKLTLTNGHAFYDKGLGFEFGIHSHSYSSRDDCCRGGEPHNEGWDRARYALEILKRYVELREQEFKSLYTEKLKPAKTHGK